jgi:hypothetical protein
MKFSVHLCTCVHVHTFTMCIKIIKRDICFISILIIMYIGNIMFPSVLYALATYIVKGTQA